MVEIGKFNKLRVIRNVDYGFFLDGYETWGEILLPMKYAPLDLKFYDDLDVFIYFDSQDRIIATTLKPHATVGEFALLEVNSVEETGVFLDWGLEKHLFVPFREQLFKMVPGRKYVVYVYVDNTQRIAATTRLDKHIDKSKPPFTVGDEVELLIYQETDLGFKAIINGQYAGQIYRDDIINHLRIGQKCQGYIFKIRDDNKIDLTLRPAKQETRDELAELILKKLNDAGGTLKINAKTPADVINAEFKVSRNKFKIALGHLYKSRKIAVNETGIELVK